MTVEVNDRRKLYPCNGVADTFTGPSADLASEIAVYLIDDALLSVTPVSTGEYTLAGLGRKRTTIATNTVYPAGKSLLILRTLPYDQQFNATNEDAYLPETLERSGLDRLAKQIQQLADGASRSLRLSDSYSGPATTELPEPVALWGLRWNLDRTALEYFDYSGGFAAPTGANSVGFLQSGAGASPSTVSAALNTALDRAAANDFDFRFREFGAHPQKPCVLKRISSTILSILRPLGGPFWQAITLSTNGVANGPYSWNGTAIYELFKFITSASSACAYTGAWSTLGSANPAAYVGGVGKQFANGNGTQFVDVSVTLDGPADLYVIYTGRTTGGYAKVEIDGDTNAATLLPSNGTYRYIDTYTPVDLQYKRAVMIASGVAAGAHTIRLTAMTDTNAAVVGIRHVSFEAIALVGDATGLPGDTGTDAPLWAATTAYAQYQQILTSAGRYYSCSVAGTTSSAEPTHTSGNATDGSVTWTFMASSSYSGRSHTLQAAGSQLEYAYQVRPTGAPSNEDVGGVVHGNEELQALSLSLDGVLIADVPVGKYVKGRSIQVIQTIKATHSFTGATAVNTTILTHNVDAAGVRVTHEHTWGVNATIGFFYSAMWPLLHWSTIGFRYGVTHLWTPQSGEKLVSDYYGQSNPIIGNSPDFIMAAKGQVLMPAGSGGAPSATAGDYMALCWLRVDPQSVGNYAKADSIKAGMAMNIAGTTAPGFSSVVSKMYFERCDADLAATVAAGEKWTCSAFYGLQLIPKASAEPWK